MMMMKIMLAFPLAVSFILILLLLGRSDAIGVCYGMDGNNLPAASEVVSMYKSKGIGRMRIYNPDGATLNSLKGSNIEVLMDVAKGDVENIANDKNAAQGWVNDNVLKYWPQVKFKYIAVGNELINHGGTPQQYILQAIKNIDAVLSGEGIGDKIKVSTAVDTGVLGDSYPPSAGAFKNGQAQTYLNPIVRYLATTGAPLLVNVYPYFSYTSNKAQISFQYATFTASGIVTIDGQYNYNNLFDALVDSVYAAMEKVGGFNVPIVVSESGWPSAGGDSASTENAKIYNSNLIRHVSSGTPRRAGKAIETYIFSMFNENEKPAGIERNWGLFYPNKNPVYPITF
ncbi:Beta-1,3-endoglucanase, family GH17 [Zostera marina]|uniref:Beta-1,3-endoglucanase, family GH17 n=1 Tax=Zostera marina TaxID=29655 RepID=A0A0K9P090_ZOSMR|nr:Beta-1,3-endoglucanase, family GH17 [Zostera marina]